MIDSFSGLAVDAQTRRLFEETVVLLEDLGHRVEPVAPPVDVQMWEDVVRLFALFAFAVRHAGTLLFGPSFAPSKLTPLRRGMAARFRKQFLAAPGSIRRMRRSAADSAAFFSKYDILLWPVVTHLTPEMLCLDFEKPHRDRNPAAAFPENASTSDGGDVRSPCPGAVPDVQVEVIELALRVLRDLDVALGFVSNFYARRAEQFATDRSPFAPFSGRRRPQLSGHTRPRAGDRHAVDGSGGVLARAEGAEGAAIRSYVGRPLRVWDNYPVNDVIMANELFLGPYRGRDAQLGSAGDAVLLAPML